MIEHDCASIMRRGKAAYAAQKQKTQHNVHLCNEAFVKQTIALFLHHVVPVAWASHTAGVLVEPQQHVLQSNVEKLVLLNVQCRRRADLFFIVKHSAVVRRKMLESGPVEAV